MTHVRLLRTLAIALAVTAVVDPPWTRYERAPVSVLLEPQSDPDALVVRRDLESRLGRLVTFASPNEPAAVVLAGVPRVPLRMVRDDVPVSTVLRREPEAPNVRLITSFDYRSRRSSPETIC